MVMKRDTSLIFNICNQCNMRCRHCSNEDSLSDHMKADSLLILKWLEDASDAGIREVTFVGGEPFLFLNDLVLYCAKAKELGMNSCIITNAYWANTKDEALQILNKLDGLSSLLVSSDVFHLEYIDSRVIENALDACIEMNINVALNATCAMKSEKKKIWDMYSKYKNHIFINTHMLMPIGAAKKLCIEKWVLKEKIDLLPTMCGISNFLVGMDGEVHGCCNAILSKNQLLYVGNIKQNAVKEIIQKINEDPLYKFIKTYGPRGIGKVIKDSPYYNKLEQNQYTCECDFCVDILGCVDHQKYFTEFISV